MKKNKMMRLASFLLVAVLLTTSIISGTYAKYVTTGEASDQARVAKFGVQIDASGNLFSKTYYNVNKGNTPADETEPGIKLLTVESSDEAKLVAPGTQSSKDDPFTLKLSGKPEVDVKVTLKIDDDYQDIWLAEGWFPDRTTAVVGDPVYNEDLYKPLKFTLKRGNSELKTGSLDEIKTFLETYEIYVNANTEMTDAKAYTFTLSWEWDFDDEGRGTKDKLDTLLGDIAAFRTGTTCQLKSMDGLTNDGAELTQNAHYNVDVSIKLSITVTQVD